MRHLKRIWRSLEQIPGLADIPAEWKVHCGTEYPLIAPFLRATNEFGRRHSCPHPRDADCPRAIVEYGDGSLAAVCQHPHRRCEDLPLTTSEALIHRLDLAGLIRAIAQPLAVRAQQPEPVAPGVWAVGTSTSSASRNQPAFLAVHTHSHGFRGAVHRLTASRTLPFVLVAPTSRFATVELRELLQNRGSSIVVLEDRVGVSAEGQFIELEPTGGTTLPPTPVAKRKAVVANYRKNFDCTNESIYAPLGVDKADFHRWVRGELEDESIKSKRIEEALRLPPQQRRRT